MSTFEHYRPIKNSIPLQTTIITVVLGMLVRYYFGCFKDIQLHECRVQMTVIKITPVRKKKPVHETIRHCKSPIKNIR